MFLTYGNKKGEAVLLLPDEGMKAEELVQPLEKLGDKYCLLVPQFSAGEEIASRAKALETVLLREYHLHLAGAYGIGTGGRLLLELLSLENTYIRGAVVEGPCGLPEKLDNIRGELYYWKNSKSGKAKKECKALKKMVPGLRTLKLKKLKKQERILFVRPDLMAKQLDKAFREPKKKKGK